MKLKNYLKKFKYHYLLGSICMLLAIVLDLMSPFLTRRIIDDVILDCWASDLAEQCWDM